MNFFFKERCEQSNEWLLKKNVPQYYQNKSILYTFFFKQQKTNFPFSKIVHCHKCKKYKARNSLSKIITICKKNIKEE